MNGRFPRWLILTGWALAALAARGLADPTVAVRDVTMLAGQAFQMPLDGFDPDGSPLTFAVVSISDTNVTGTLTSGNRSLQLEVTGQDANTNDFSGQLVFELFEDLAPLTSTRIIELVETNFYNGLTFHRIINNFVAQGGDPLGNGTGGSGVEFDDEFNLLASFTGFGQLAMANSGDDSNDSQFFITDVDLTLADEGGSLEPPRHLTFNHTIFGQLTSGFDVLDTLINTPTDGNGSPLLTNVTIVSAMVFTNTEDAVLRLFAPTNFTGSATVTVSATTTNNVTTEASFTVTVIANTRNERPFLSPLPDLVTTQNVQTAVILETTDLEDDNLFLTARDAITLGSLTNVQLFFDSDTQELTFVPAPNFTGEIEILIGARDSTDRGGSDLDEYDTERIRLTVLPGGGGPSLDVVLEKGQLFNAITGFEDRVMAKGTIAFNGNALDQSFDPMTELFELYLGDAVNGVLLSLNPGDEGWKAKNNKFQWQTPKESFVKVKLKFDLKKGKFSFKVRRFNFDGPQRNPMQFQFTMGPDSGSDTKTWREQHVGIHVFP